MMSLLVCKHERLRRSCPLCERDEEIERLLGLLRRALPWIGHRPVSLTSADYDVAEVIRDVMAAVEGEP